MSMRILENSTPSTTQVLPRPRRVLIRIPRSVWENRHWLTDSSRIPPDISLPSTTAPWAYSIRQFRITWRMAGVLYRAPMYIFPDLMAMASSPTEKRTTM